MPDRRRLYRAAAGLERCFDRLRPARASGRLVILDYYPETRFLLIGDNGQHDPEIYLQVIQAHRGRIAGAFIRDVTTDQGVARIIEESRAAGVEMVYVEHSAVAIEHAKRMGVL